MGIKLIALDVDGTLVHSDGTLSENNLFAVEEAAAEGVNVVINSGRTFYELPEESIKSDAFSYYIYSNGAAIADEDGKLIYSAFIDEGIAKGVLDTLQKCNTMIEIYSHGHPHTESKYLCNEAYDYFDIEDCYRGVVETTRVGIQNTSEFFYKNANSVEMFNVFFKNQDERNKCFEIFSRIPGLKVTTSMPTNMEIFSDKADKGTALKYLAEYFNIDREDVMAMGDSRNDLPMVKYAGVGVALDNACDDLKKVADVVTVSNDEDGVAAMIESSVLTTKVTV